VLDLDTLSPPQACDMLIRLCGRPDLSPDEVAIADIARLCGYLPLAIGLTAAQLRHDARLTPAVLAARLAAAQVRPELMHAESLSVSTAFDMSYRDLDSARRRLFRRLALEPGGDTDSYAAAALDGLDIASAHRGLEVLYDHYLLTQPAPGRYGFHDLIREHARSLAAADPAVERDSALTRLLDYYLSTARAADRHLTWRTTTGAPVAVTMPPVHAPELRSRDEALSWMDAQSVNLRAAVSYAAAHGKITHAIAIPAAMTGYLLTRSRWAEGITLHLIALTAADEADDRAAAAGTLTDLGRLRHMTGDPAAARNLTQAAAIQRGLGNKIGEAHALAALGTLHHSTGHFKSATRSLSRALRLYRECADLAGEARARYDIGVIQYQTGKYPAAMTSLRAALRMFRHYPDRLGQADTISYMAAIDRETGRYTSAAANMTVALGIYRDLANQHEEAGALMFLGGMQYPTGNYPAALRNLTAALDMYRDLHETFGEAAVLNELGIVYRLTGDLVAAAASLNRALDLFRGWNSRNGEAEVLSNLGRVQCQAGDYPIATATLRRALALHKELSTPNGVANTLSSLGELMLASGAGQARPYFEQALAIAVEVSLLPEEARARAGIGSGYLAEGDSDAGVASLRHALEIYQQMGSPVAEDTAALLASLSHHDLM
jgi:tetratricopeptide (TPR) repeat protein